MGSRCAIVLSSINHRSDKKLLLFSTCQGFCYEQKLTFRHQAKFSLASIAELDKMSCLVFILIKKNYYSELKNLI